MIRKIDSNIFSLTILKVTTFSRIRQNAPKVLAKGKYAQAVRKAALASIGAKAKKDDAKKTSNYPYKFEWNLE